MWLEMKEQREEGVLDEGKGRVSEMELVDDLTTFTAYCCTVRGSKEGTAMGKL